MAPPILPTPPPVPSNPQSNLNLPSLPPPPKLSFFQSAAQDVLVTFNDPHRTSKAGAWFRAAGKVLSYIPLAPGAGVGKIMNKFITMKFFSKSLVSLEQDFKTASQQGICAKVIGQINDLESRLPVPNNILGSIIVFPFFITAKILLKSTEAVFQVGRLGEQLIINPKDFYLKGILLLIGEPIAFSLFVVGASLVVSGFTVRMLTGNEVINVTTDTIQMQQQQEMYRTQHIAKREEVRKETEDPVAFFTKHSSKMDEGIKYLEENVSFMLPDKRREFLKHIENNKIKAPQELLNQLQK